MPREFTLVVNHKFHISDVILSLYACSENLGTVVSLVGAIRTQVIRPLARRKGNIARYRRMIYLEIFEIIDDNDLL